MRFLNRKQKDLMAELTQLAGDPRLVRSALQTLTKRKGAAPTLTEVVQYILEQRVRQEATRDKVSSVDTPATNSKYSQHGVLVGSR